jgi:hypothetical protein
MTELPTNDAKHTGNGLHPNSSGNQILADSWFNPLVVVLKVCTSHFWLVQGEN